MHQNTYKTTADSAHYNDLNPRQKRKLGRFKEHGARVCIDKIGRVVVVLDKYGRFE